MGFLKKILLHLGLGHHPFDPEIWRQSISKRKCFVEAILKNRIGLGMNMEQLVSTFGDERTVYLNGINSYKISVFKKGITTDRNTRKTLDFYFDEQGIVVNMKLKMMITN